MLVTFLLDPVIEGVGEIVRGRYTRFLRQSKMCVHVVHADSSPTVRSLRHIGGVLVHRTKRENKDGFFKNE